jgi:hypothetical protein
MQTIRVRCRFTYARCRTFLQNALHGYVVLVWTSVRPVRKKEVVQFVIGGEALISDELSTSQEPPFDLRRATRCCRFSIPTPPALPVTKNILAIHCTLLTAEHPASLQMFHASARHLLMFVACLSVPLLEPPQPAHSISPCTPRVPLD